jgi:hypothetical protein
MKLSLTQNELVTMLNALESAIQNELSYINSWEFHENGSKVNLNQMDKDMIKRCKAFVRKIRRLQLKMRRSN